MNNFDCAMKALQLGDQVSIRKESIDGEVFIIHGTVSSGMIDGRNLYYDIKITDYPDVEDDVEKEEQ